MAKDFSSGTMDRDLPANARDMGPIPGPRGSYICNRQLKPVSHNYWAHAPRAMLCTESYALQRERPRRETCVVPQSSPHSRQQESPHTAAKTQCNRKTNQEKRMVTMVKYMSCVFATTKIKKKKIGEKRKKKITCKLVTEPQLGLRQSRQRKTQSPWQELVPHSEGK